MGSVMSPLKAVRKQNRAPEAFESSCAAVARIAAWGYGFRARRQIGTADFPAPRNDVEGQLVTQSP